MMMKHFKSVSIAVSALLLCAAVFTSCGNDDDNKNRTAKVSVKLTDAPGDYEAVNIDVQDVLIKRDNTNNDESGWESIGPVDAGIYNLLELTGGVNVLLVEEDIPAGRLEQIRLVLGEENTVVIDGVEIPLSTPSAQQSGLKLNVHADLEAGYTYDFIMDFDVDQSIVVAGASGQFILKPVIRISTEASSGIITGVASPADFQVLASVETGDGEIISAYTNEEGTFMLYGIPEGHYTVTLTPEEESGYSPATIDNVEVINGQTSNIGTINIGME